ncbi:EamA family transporter [Robiginitalea sediminis]|uniref:EamA family transporter n=1 Tax=Robiginitalea sediminis TaxID=1982593 RepID=UPI000B4A83D0|nr:EamA family transporter [Robiginitalea sediminis]
MTDLLLSIGCSSLIFVIFRLYKTYGVHTPTAIVGNYYTAFSTGLALAPEVAAPNAWASKPWLLPALMLGVLFVVIFNLMARSSQNLGVSVTSVATKMSLVIPVTLGIYLYGEHLSFLQGFGIVLALWAVYCTSRPPRGMVLRKGVLGLPLLVFLGSGIIDASLKYLEEHRVPAAEFPIFSSTVFFAAGTCGLLSLLLRPHSDNRGSLPRNLLGGLALGVPNFFSVYFLLRALTSGVWNSAVVFTLNNVAIVLLTTLLGVWLFRERLSRWNQIGIVSAVISILLVSL